MVFPSVVFLCYFLPLFLVAYALFPFRNLTILVFSLVFYTWGELFYVTVLLGSIAANYAFGLWITASDGGRVGQRRVDRGDDVGKRRVPERAGGISTGRSARVGLDPAAAIAIIR